MLLEHGTVVAVADGETLHLYRNSGTDIAVKLVPVAHGTVEGDNMGSGGRHHSSAANPDDRQLTEDSFAAATAALLNTQALEGKFDALFVIAAPKTLGELRKHWHKALESKLVGELAKELTGHSIGDIETAVANS